MAVGVESPHDRGAVIVEIALDIERAAERGIKTRPGRVLAAKAEVHAFPAVERDRRHHARDRRPSAGKTPSLAYSPPAPVRIGHDRPAAGLVQGDALRPKCASRQPAAPTRERCRSAALPIRAPETRRSSRRSRSALSMPRRSIRRRCGVDHVADRDQRKTHRVGTLRWSDRSMLDRSCPGSRRECWRR